MEEDVEINFNIYFLYPVNLKITLDPDVEHLPIRIDEPYYRAANKIEEAGIEVERLFQIDKNNNWQVMFTRRTPEGQRQRVLFDMMATNTTDLVEFEFTISNDDFEDF